MKQALFLSKCGGEVSQAIDLELLSRQYAHLAAVRVVEDFYHPEDLEQLLEEVESKELESLVLAGDSPYALSETRSGGQLFRYLEARGIDRNRVEVVNLKNMVAKPHKVGGPQGVSREALQEKAQLLIEVALEKVRDSKPITQLEIAPRRNVAVVGGGPASIATAQQLLEEGYRVFLLHRRAELILDPRHLAHIRPTLTAVLRNDRFKLLLEAAATDFSGYAGDYTLQLTSRGERVELQVGAVVLAPDGDPGLARELQAVFHVDIDEEGGVAARDETTARSQTLDRGVFVINPPKGNSGDLAASVLAGDAAAALVINLLNRNEISHRVTVSEVNTHLCGGCGVCVKTCMFHAVSLQGDPPVSVIDPRRCRGCGNCVTACPGGARDLLVSPTAYLTKAVDILARFSHAEPGRKLLLLACSGCGYRCLDAAAASGLTWPAGILPLQVVCGGQIDTRLIMQAFVSGFDGVLMAICGEGCCHNLIGNVDLERRVNLLRDILTSRGIDHDRVHIISTCSRSGGDCVKTMNELYAQFGDRAQPLRTLILA